MKSNAFIALTLFSALALPAVLSSPAQAQETPAPPPVADPAPPPPTETPTEPTVEEPEPNPDAGRFFVGLDFQYYLPTTDKARQAFGDKFISISPGLGAVEKISEKGRIVLDFSIISNNIAKSRVFIVPIGVSYARRFGSGDNIVPYVGASANVYFADIRSARRDFDIKAGLRTGFGGSLFTGLNFGRGFYVQARYYAVTKLSGIDLSGLSLTTGVRFRF